MTDEEDRKFFSLARFWYKCRRSGARLSYFSCFLCISPRPLCALRVVRKLDRDLHCLGQTLFCHFSIHIPLYTWAGGSALRWKYNIHNHARGKDNKKHKYTHVVCIWPRGENIWRLVENAWRTFLEPARA